MDNGVNDEKKAGIRLPACIVCGAELKADEIALTRKLINRGTKDYMCLKCLARKFEVKEDVLRQKIVQYREMGCTLFS